MVVAAIGVLPAATISHEAMFALGVVLAAVSLLALGFIRDAGEGSLRGVFMK